MNSYLNLVKFPSRKSVTSTLRHHFWLFSTISLVKLLLQTILRTIPFWAFSAAARITHKKFLFTISPANGRAIFTICGLEGNWIELMECCNNAHLKHVHQWRFLRIHGIFSYHSQTGFSLKFAQITVHFLSQHLWGADFLSTLASTTSRMPAPRFMLLCSFPLISENRRRKIF